MVNVLSDRNLNTFSIKVSEQPVKFHNDSGLEQGLQVILLNLNLTVPELILCRCYYLGLEILTDKIKFS